MLLLLLLLLLGFAFARLLLLRIVGSALRIGRLPRRLLIGLRAGVLRLLLLLRRGLRRGLP